MNSLQRLRCFAASAMMLIAPNADAANVSDFIDFTLRNPRQVLLPGRLYVPPEATAASPRPLMVWLHGGGYAGTNNLNQLGGDIDGILAEAKRRGAYLYAPQAPLNWRPKTITDHVVTMLTRAGTEHHVDSARIYMTGYSSGGGGAWNMVSRYPGILAATLPVAPVSPEPDFNPANVVGQPVAAIHARNDGVAPVSVTRGVVTSVLAAAGLPAPVYPGPSGPTFGIQEDAIKFYYFEPPLGDHSVHFAVFTEPSVYDWMFAQSLAVPEPGNWALAGMAAVAGVTWRRSTFRRRQDARTSA